MADFFILLGCSLLALMGHGAVKKKWLEWVVRGLIFLWFAGEALYLCFITSGIAVPELQVVDAWVFDITYGTCALTGFDLIRSFRQALSYVLSAINCLFSWSVIKAAFKNRTA